MEIATKESILSLLNSTDFDDVKLGIIILLREAVSQQEIVDIVQNKAVNTNEFSYWRCKDKWLFINGTRFLASLMYCAPDQYSYNNAGNKAIIHEVYDPE